MAEESLVKLAKNIGYAYALSYSGCVQNIKENDSSVEADFVDEDDAEPIHFRISWVPFENDNDLILLKYCDKEIYVSAYPNVICAILYAS